MTIKKVFKFFIPALFVLLSFICFMNCGKKGLEDKKTENEMKYNKKIEHEGDTPLVPQISPFVKTKATDLLSSLLMSGKGYDTLVKKDSEIPISIINDNCIVIQELLSNNLNPQSAGNKENMTERYLEIAKSLKLAQEKVLVHKIVEFEIIKTIRSECNIWKFNMDENLNKICGGDFTESAESLNKVNKIFGLNISHTSTYYKKANTPLKLINFIESEINGKIF